MSTCCGDKTESQPKCSCFGMAVGDARSKDNAQDVANAELEGVGVHAGRGAGSRELVVELVYPFVKRFEVNETMRQKEPDVDDQYVKDLLWDFILPSPVVCVESECWVCYSTLSTMSTLSTLSTTVQASAEKEDSIFVQVPRRNHDEPCTEEDVEGRHTDGLTPFSNSKERF